MMPAKVQLHEHDPDSLLPLLTRYLPHTQAVLGAIVSCPPPGHTPQSVLDAPPLETMYASFPPGHLPSDNETDWLVALALPAPSEQVRIWHRAEVGLNLSEIARVRKINGSVVSTEALRAAETATLESGGQAAAAQVIQARQIMREKYPHHFVMGQLNAAWELSLREALKAPSRGICRVFLAPEELPSTGSDDERLKELGLKLDTTRVGDEGEMSRLTKYHPPKYILARSRYTTLVRPIEGGAPVCWVLTHADGSLGALYTLPDWRRKGLAKIVVAERLRAMAESDSEGSGEADRARAEASRELRANLQVEEHNEASEALWTGLGWEAAWCVAWVYAQEDQDKYRSVTK